MQAKEAFSHEKLKTEGLEFQLTEIRAAMSESKDALSTHKQMQRKLEKFEEVRDEAARQVT
jgi:hypothetical protein